jgi:hypothetical protein
MYIDPRCNALVWYTFLAESSLIQEHHAMTTPPPPAAFELTASRQFPAWLAEQRLSLAFTTYQAGKLFFIGLHSNLCRSGSRPGLASWQQKIVAT